MAAMAHSRREGWNLSIYRHLQAAAENMGARGGQKRAVAEGRNVVFVDVDADVAVVINAYRRRDCGYPPRVHILSRRDTQISLRKKTKIQPTAGLTSAKKKTLSPPPTASSIRTEYLRSLSTHIYIRIYTYTYTYTPPAPIN